MTQLDVVTLQEAKDFLRVDYQDDDAIITSNIKSAISYVEQRTNYRLFDRKEDVYGNGPFNLYQFPIAIDSVTDGSTDEVLDASSYKAQYRTLRLYLDVKSCNGVKVTLSVGYTNRDQIPADLIDAVKKMVVHLYQNRDNYQADIPSDIYMLIQPFMRFHGI